MTRQEEFITSLHKLQTEYRDVYVGGTTFVRGDLDFMLEDDKELSDEEFFEVKNRIGHWAWDYLTEQAWGFIRDALDDMKKENA